MSTVTGVEGPAAPSDEMGLAPPVRSGPGGRALVLATAVAVATMVVSSLWTLTRRPFWIDEAISLGATNQLVATVRGTGGTMALYYVLLDAWTAVVGTSPAAVRSLSVVLAACGLVAVAGAASRLLRPPEAVVAVLLTGALPAVVRMAQDARAYALVLLLAAACWMCLARALEAEEVDPGGDRSRPWFLALAPLAVAGMLSHGLFALHLVAVLASVLVLPRRWTLLRRLVPAGVAAGLAIAGLLALGAAGVGDWIPPLDADQVATFARGLGTQVSWVNVVLAALVAVGTVVLGRRAGRSAGLDRWRALAPLWWGLLAPAGLLVLSVVRPTLLDRYAFASLPGLAMLAAVGAVGAVDVARRPRKVEHRRDPDGTPVDPAPRLAAPVLVAALVAGVLAVGLVEARVARTDLAYEDWDATVELVAAEARPGDAIVFPHAVDQAHPDTVRPPFEAAWSRLPDPPLLTPLDPARPLGEVRRFDDLRPPADVSRDMVEHPRVWAVFFPGSFPSLDDQLSREPAASILRPVGHWTLGGGIEVLLYAQRS